MSVQSVLAQLRKSCDSPPPDFGFSHEKAAVSRPAAVIVPILDYGDRATLLLTKRTAHLSAHAGQVCFPGGMREEDDCDLQATALRECEEELGIPAEAITIIGEGRGRITGTGFHITPFIGHIHAPIALSPDPFEVELAFELPLETAIRRAAYQKLRTTHAGVTYAHDMLNHQGHCIWGATAGILRDLCRMVHNEPWEEKAC